ncbi:MAG TPA: hypothetical protein VGR37_14575 [Longimicrobiaceae bacterium]|nr:hypothetical protein [Longimicrobiaceae bacterium]
MSTRLRGMMRAALALVLLTGAGCGPGIMEDVLEGVVYPDRYPDRRDDRRGSYRDEIRGEVSGVDTRNRRIHVRERDGRGVTAYYDGRTRVEHRGRDYRVSALERGDEVSIRVRRDGRHLYADHVYVRESARDRGGRGRDRDRGRDERRYVERVEGRVQSINQGQGRIQVRDERGGRVVVSLPRDASRGTWERFRRLRRGDYVRMDVVPTGRDRAELYRFR